MVLARNLRRSLLLDPPLSVLYYLLRNAMHEDSCIHKIGISLIVQSSLRSMPSFGCIMFDGTCINEKGIATRMISPLSWRRHMGVTYRKKRREKEKRKTPPNIAYLKIPELLANRHFNNFVNPRKSGQNMTPGFSHIAQSPPKTQGHECRHSLPQPPLTSCNPSRYPSCASLSSCHPCG